MKTKATHHIFIFLFLGLLSPGLAQIEMNGTGDVGIGITPSTSYGLRVGGDSYVSGELRSKTAYFTGYTSVPGSTDATIKIAGAWEGVYYNSFIAYGDGKIRGTVAVTSDERLKKNIQPIENTLEKIMLLSGKSYEYKEYSEIKNVGIKGTYEYQKDTLLDEKSGEIRIIDEEEQAFSFSKGKHLGILAQDVQPLFPELVQYDEVSGVYYVDYNGFVPVFIEAIKEQQTQILDLKNRVAEMEELISELSKTDASVNGRLGNETTNDFSLQQNVPNPSSEETRIDFSIPKNVNQASIYIYDLQGRQVKRELNDRIWKPDPTRRPVNTLKKCTP